MKFLFDSKCFWFSAFGRRRYSRARQLTAAARGESITLKRQP
ncbi:hypothetical protein RHOER0001_4380 [Rhodococcus erythropolis SK121]|nr:hypothetical protein RHOER0001_4380 [Rhodococcus erythropolis SK121]